MPTSPGCGTENTQNLENVPFPILVTSLHIVAVPFIGPQNSNLYIALSMASRELIPLRCLVTELHKQCLFTAPLHQPFAITKTSTLEATNIYEGNASCIVLAHSEGT
jgi:hypothetical protein